jgi:hypothetical protein
MDVNTSAEWEEGTEVKGVRTHFYPEVSIEFASEEQELIILE